MSRSPLKWALPAVVLLVVAVFAILVTAEDNSNSGSTVSSKDNQGAPATEASSNGTLTAGGQDLFAVKRGGLEPLVGKSVTGRNVTVQTVRGQGVWVGTGQAQRVFVQGGSTDGLKIGERVNVDGTVRGVPKDAGGTLGLSGQDLRDVRLQAGYVDGTAKPSS